MVDLSMAELWRALPIAVQDATVLLLLCAPLPAIWAAMSRGYAPGPLVRAALLRDLWANGAFVTLIAVSCAVGVGVIAQERALRVGGARAADKFDVIIAAPGSATTMMMATVFLEPTDAPLVDGRVMAELSADPRVDFAAPIAFGDSHEGAPVVGATAEFVAHLSGPLTEGRPFRSAFEVVAGAHADVAVGETFQPAHGLVRIAPARAGRRDGPVGRAVARAGLLHGVDYTVVGRMAPTGGPWDRALVAPVEGVWRTHGLADGHPPGAGDRIGPPFDPEYFPGAPAIVVRAASVAGAYGVRSAYARTDLMAFFPGETLARVYALLGDARRVMSAMALVSQLLVTLGVLVGVALLIRLHRRKAALLWALGAPIRFIVAVVWGQAAALIAVGAVVGLALGAAAAGLVSALLEAETNVALSAELGWPEAHLVAAFASVAGAAALAPAALAARLAKPRL